MALQFNELDRLVIERIDNMHLLPQSFSEINRPSERLVVALTGALIVFDGRVTRKATGIDLLRLPRPTRRADGYREE